jgi:probable phosphoglycerate mutase
MAIALTTSFDRNSSMDSQYSAQSGSTRVILVRHGQSTFNAEGKYQGRSDESVLTAKGYHSAYQTGVALQRIQIDAIYTSPLQRAIETTQEIIKGIGSQHKCLLEFNVDHNLTEIDLPAWQGKTFEYVRHNFAAEYKCWQQRPHQFQINSIENIGYHSQVATALKQCFPVLNLYEQAQQFWQTVLPRHLGKTILVVSHGGTNRALISSALNLSPAQYHTIQQSNCGINILNFLASSQSAKVSGLNLTSHLGEILPKLKAGKQGLRLLLLPIDAIASNQIYQLAEFLKPVPIDFSLTSELCISQDTSQLLQNHPTTVQLQVSRHNFPLVWQQTIDSRRSAAPNTLVTGLVIASSAIIKCILGQILGLNADNSWRLQLNSGDFSVVHYPLGDHLPVSQTINLSDTQIKIP